MKFLLNSGTGAMNRFKREDFEAMHAKAFAKSACMGVKEFMASFPISLNDPASVFFGLRRPFPDREYQLISPYPKLFLFAAHCLSSII